MEMASLGECHGVAGVDTLVNAQLSDWINLVSWYVPCGPKKGYVKIPQIGVKLLL